MLGKPSEFEWRQESEGRSAPSEEKVAKKRTPFQRWRGSPNKKILEEKKLGFLPRKTKNKVHSPGEETGSLF